MDCCIRVCYPSRAPSPNIGAKGPKLDPWANQCTAISQDVYEVCMRTIYASGSFSYVSGELESALERHDRRSRSGSTTRGVRELKGPILDHCKKHALI